MKILITTAPFEAENTGDISYARQMERCLRNLGHEVIYLRAQELGLAVEVSKALDTSVRLSVTYAALKKIGDSLLHCILTTIPKDTVLFMHFRIPHTGFSFSTKHLSQLKAAGYKICALINEHSCNREEPTEIERNYQTAQLIPFFDQIITFNPIDKAGLLETAGTKNFYHCADNKTLAKSNAWTLFQVGNAYPEPSSLEERISLIPAPILSAQKYDPGPEERPDNILMFGTIRRNKGNTATLNLAQLLADKGVPTIQIKIVGKVLADMNGFNSFRQYVLSTFPERLGFCADFKPLERMLAEKEHRVEKLSSLDDYENEFNSLCKEIVSDLELQVTKKRPKALPIEFHIDVSEESFRTLCHQSRYGIKFDKKGFCDNASTIINMMGFGLIVISNKTHMMNPVFNLCPEEELPLVLLDTMDPEAELLFQTILNLKEDTLARQRVLNNLERVMTTMYDPMRVTSQVVRVLEKALNVECHAKKIAQEDDKTDQTENESSSNRKSP
ncbi:hypothetical protein [Legionella birminghamensis]|uniref:hypothetical protein n=1 Tax=Legionella birminghamensis TaxID=28083 RepID=UPI001041B96C|nr:hypothetical protein [Legionella birminghamensis]